VITASHQIVLIFEDFSYGFLRILLMDSYGFLWKVIVRTDLPYRDATAAVNRPSFHCVQQSSSDPICQIGVLKILPDPDRHGKTACEIDELIDKSAKN